MRLDLTVTPDAGDPIRVTAGQREMAAWEREPFGCSSIEAGERSPLLFFRYIAYAALRRQRRLEVVNGRSPTFEAWDAQIDMVVPADDGDEDAEAEPGPTQPDQSPGT